MAAAPGARTGSCSRQGGRWDELRPGGPSARISCVASLFPKAKSKTFLKQHPSGRWRCRRRFSPEGSAPSRSAGGDRRARSLRRGREPLSVMLGLSEAALQRPKGSSLQEDVPAGGDGGAGEWGNPPLCLAEGSFGSRRDLGRRSRSPAAVSFHEMLLQPQGRVVGDWTPHRLRGWFMSRGGVMSAFALLLCRPHGPELGSRSVPSVTGLLPNYPPAAGAAEFLLGPCRAANRRPSTHTPRHRQTRRCLVIIPIIPSRTR